ncbi:VCBS repeat-containing protein, partial [bacterium]|nr:VCBS repeat-containing protein [bacterium]
MKRIYIGALVTIFIFMSVLCFSQIMYKVGNDPNTVTAADVSGDGYLDLLVSNRSASTLSVLMNNGDGTFASQVLYKTNPSPSPVVTADIDNDGDIDMLVSSIIYDYYYKISVFINYGDGTFAPGVIYDTASPKEITLSDVDNDGFVDLLISSFDDVVMVLINNKDGTFAPYVSYETEEGPEQVTAADVNNDGYDDMLVSCRNWGNYYSHVMVYINKGDGTFKKPKSYNIYNVIWDPNRVTAADVNNDGFVDMLVSCSDSARIYVFINNANGIGTFSQKPMMVNYKSARYPREVTAADVNKDGAIDMLVSSYNEQQGISVFFNDGDGDFKLDNIYSSDNISEITVKDITQDGYPDIVANGQLSSDISYIGVMLNNGDGTYENPTLYLAGVENNKVTLSDINNDGFDDALTTVERINVSDNGYNSHVVVWFGQGDGTFGYDPADTEPPEIAIVSPSDGSEFIGRVLVRITASDGSLIDSVDIRIDDGDWLPCELIEDYWEYDIDPGRDFEDKVLRIQGRAIDRARNANTSYTDIINIKVSPWIYTDCYVDVEKGNDDNEGFILEAPLKTISSAVFRVSVTQESPVTVHIAKGLYNKDSGEEFPIEMRSYVSLEGMS